MQNINQILVTLIEANRLATAANPHFQRLGLVLFDNAVELQLRRRSESTLMLDDTTCYSGVRKYNRKRRKKISRYHRELLALAVDEAWITADDSLLLSFAHNLRNHAYHSGISEGETDLQIGLTLLIRFVAKYFPQWRGAGLLMTIPSESSLSFEDVDTDSSGRAPMLFGFEQTEPSEFFPDTGRFGRTEHWQKILETVLTYDYKKDVRPLIKRRLENAVTQLREDIECITKYDDVNFGSVLDHRFHRFTPWFDENLLGANPISDPRIALNIYVAVLEHEERLLDISDLGERADEFAKLVNGHDWQKEILSSIDFDRYDSICNQMTTIPESSGIEQFLQVESEIANISLAARECAMDMNGYAEYVNDTIQGR